MAGYIAELQGAMAAMSEDPANRSRLYLTDRELAALPCMAHDTVFAVRTDAMQQELNAPSDACICMQYLQLRWFAVCMAYASSYIQQPAMADDQHAVYTVEGNTAMR